MSLSPKNRASSSAESQHFRRAGIPGVTRSTPWYREPWPWLLMMGPLFAIFGGLFMIWLAIETADGLVSDDYYKEGLAINRSLQRDLVAHNLHYRAEMKAENGRIRLHFAGKGPLPGVLRLHFVHPSRAEQDRVVELQALGDGWYEGRFATAGRGRWGVILDDNAATWRLTGEWDIASGAPIVLGADAAN